MFEVVLKPGHPTGVYHRAGQEFNKTTPVKMATVPKAIAEDPNLQVTEKARPAPVPAWAGAGNEKPEPAAASARSRSEKSDR